MGREAGPVPLTFESRDRHGATPLAIQRQQTIFGRDPRKSDQCGPVAGSMQAYQWLLNNGVGSRQAKLSFGPDADCAILSFASHTYDDEAVFSGSF